MSALPKTAAMALDPVPDPLPSTAMVPAPRRSRRRTAEIVPFRQDEDVLRSFFADTIVTTPSYGLGRRTRATLVALVAVTAGGAFVAAATKLLET